MKTARIRELNDAFRTSFEGGRVMLTAGIASLPDDVKAIIIRKVATFTAFSPDNDPYGEHDFGAIEVAGCRVFWKIDSYDRNLEFGSPDPTDPTRTTRVMTVMLAEEY
jgi:hypothetical protein